MTGLKLAQLESAAHVYELMRNRGCRLRLREGVLSSAFEVLQPQIERGDLLSEARAFFRSKAILIPEGLDELPSCWLSALPTLLWATREDHWEKLPYMIRRLDLERGVLCLKFKQEQPLKTTRLTRWDELRININRALEPNLWQELSPSTERAIWSRRPDLRRELFCLPD
jgi:hypothetical protein